MSSESPVSFLVHVARLPHNGMPVSIDANEEQRAGLAKEHELLSVRRFNAALLVEPWKRVGVRVSGRVEADVEQACAVTLEPLATEIREDIEAVFVPERSKLARPKTDARGEILLDVEGADSPETFTGDSIDVGALAEEIFALGIDPYRRKQGVALEQPGEEPEVLSPFAKLQSLKRRS
jgi:uncharacterized metal-binding protein YceD (DUF177 family)